MATNSSDTTLHLWRSKTIDAFAQAEAAVDVLVLKLNASVKVDMLSQKIDAARKAKPTSAVAEDRKKKIDQLLGELSSLLGLRNDIVHSPMVIEKVGESVFATFANPNVKCSYSSFRRIIAAPRLQALATRVTNLAKSLESA
ncbi:MAG: hypothetical protein B7X90_17990 [Novosphingobium sp. 17-62-19]|uniref:hypothetical protein n=1 Tax=Novosphingobium sp. 17-62-19 TaxID=1970406 RepID=UPI000BDAB444|nr:hypothetical protein [Novosphingobium sp. 17-62-19]OZA16509.1 MAG: hypothetical protein B7X90_17990 [Novosphingobium sp. 17-62-19]OZA64351.1 MAG: hypothetical protein B7X78_05230 [Sphingomonadales bacterium 39-62-4]HQS97148.1 hypothetical protein [Novosphingobium sp.]